MLAVNTTPGGLAGRGIHARSINWSIALSVVLIVAGLLALVAPLVAGVALEAIVGWVLVLAGLSHLILAWHVRGAGNHVWEGLIGLAYLIAGGFLFFHPLAGLVALTVILAIYLLFKGIFELVAGFSIRAVPGSRWILFDAVFSLLLSFLIWRQLPYSAEWFIGSLIGLAILFTGISRLVFALHGRRATRLPL